MKGRSWSIPYGMVFLKHYCHKCGSRLKKEKTTRIVTKEDVDYYYYHERGTFPRSDVIVNEYIYSCPHCKNKISYAEQKKYSYIQKKIKSNILSEEIIDKEKAYANKKYELSQITLKINFFITAILFTSIIIYFTSDAEGIIDFLLILGIASFFVMASLIYNAIRKRRYTFTEVDLFTKMYTISLNNKELVKTSEKCYCFHCLKEFPSEDVLVFRDDKSALCPYCETKSLIPDNAEVEITKENLEKAKKYWF